MRRCTPRTGRWTSEEDKIAIKLRLQGTTFREIGWVLRRSKHSVKCRFLQRLGIRRKVKGRPPKTAACFPFVKIQKSDLLIWYAEGWRVESFEGSSVKMFWPHEAQNDSNKSARWKIIAEMHEPVFLRAAE